MSGKEDVMTNPGRPQEAPKGSLFDEDQRVAETVIKEGAAAQAGENPPVGIATESETAKELSRPLWSIGDQYVNLVDYLTERGGEMDEESIKAWDGIRGEVAEKLENCSLMVRTLDAHGLVVKDEAKRLSARAKMVHGQRDRLKEYMKLQMNRMEMKKSEGTNISCRVQKTQAKVEVYDLDEVPPEYCSVSVTMTGVGWNNLLQILKTIIPDQTDPEAEIDHWGGLWRVDRVVDKTKVIAEWKKNQGQKDVVGTKVEQGETLIIF